MIWHRHPGFANNRHGPVCRDAGIHPGGGTAQLYARGRGPSSAALDGDRCCEATRSTSRELLPLEFIVDGVVRNVHLPATVAVNGAESLVAAARLGLGLIQVPRYHVESDLAQGALVPVLPDFPPDSVTAHLRQSVQHRNVIGTRVRLWC